MSWSYTSGTINGYPYSVSDYTYGMGPWSYSSGTIDGIPYNYSTFDYGKIGSGSGIYDAITGAVVGSVINGVLNSAGSSANSQAPNNVGVSYAFAPGVGSQSGTPYADKFYLRDFDGYGAASADVIYGFNQSQGDKLQISTTGAGWDPAKSQYSLWQAANTKERVRYRNKNGKKKTKWIDSGDNVDSIVNRDDVNALVYNTSTGELYVDRNGSTAGLGDGGLVAILQGAPSLSSDHIEWFAI